MVTRPIQGDGEQFLARHAKAKPQCAWAKSYAVGQRALRDAGLEQLPVTFQFCAIFGANVKGYPMGLML